MKIKTAELSGESLNYAVAIAIDWGEPIIHITSGFCFIELMGTMYSPSTDWVQCGPLIETYKVITTSALGVHGLIHLASIGNKTHADDEIKYAICRAVVASKLGDEVDIPDELMGDA